ncbi:unnamed protein product [Arctogadus glacialis]
MKMNPWTLSVLLLLAGPLGADPDWHVEYPESFCVVEGSTATIPCSFAHPAGLRVNRVVWCHNHEFCQRHVYFGYDSSNVRADSRFLYLGDLVRNCTLNITKTVKEDAARYRLRLKTNAEGYAGPKGVIVNVTNGEDVKVRSSVTDNAVKEGGQVTLTCTSACSFHLSNLTNDLLILILIVIRLSGVSPSLTNDDTGNYTGSLDSSRKNTSAPWCLLVLVDEEEKSGWLLSVSVVSVLLAVFLLLLAGLVFAKRRQAQKKESEVIQKQEVDREQEAVGASEEVSYATVHFKLNSSRSAPEPEHEIVYSEVVH